MRYRVATVSTPLWADRQRSLKKGIIVNGMEFDGGEEVTDGGLLMVKAESVYYDPKGDDQPRFGDGWVEAKNCVPVEAPTVTGGGAVTVVLAPGRYRISGEVVIEPIPD
jgi:hypothetical protein